MTGNGVLIKPSWYRVLLIYILVVAFNLVVANFILTGSTGHNTLLVFTLLFFLWGLDLREVVTCSDSLLIRNALFKFEIKRIPGTLGSNSESSKVKISALNIILIGIENGLEKKIRYPRIFYDFEKSIS